MKHVLTYDRANPNICNFCDSKYYVKRYLSGFFENLVLGTGLILIVMFISFGNFGWIGVASVILITTLIWCIIAFIEGQYSQTIRLTEEMEKSGKKYILAIRLIIGVALLIVISVFFF